MQIDEFCTLTKTQIEDFQDWVHADMKASSDNWEHEFNEADWFEQFQFHITQKEPSGE